MKRISNVLLTMLALAACVENEEREQSVDDNVVLFRNKFSSESVANMVLFDYYIEWHAPASGYNSALSLSYTEFPIVNTDGSHSITMGNYEVSFTLLVSEQDEGIDFYVARFYRETGTESKHVASLADPKGFSGLVHVLDTTGNMLYAQKLSAGELLNEDVFRSITVKGDARMAIDCDVVRVDHYVDWYDGTTGVYMDTYLEYATYESLCYTVYLPQLFIDGGGGAGTYSSATGGGAYNKCDDPKHGCIYKVMNKLITPCQTANRMKTLDGWTDHMNQLKATTTDNFESSFSMAANGDNSYSYTRLDGPANAEGIDFKVIQPLDGFMHSHYGGTLSIFSPFDLQSLYIMYREKKITNTRTFMFTLVTPDNSYMLKIDDEALFAEFGENSLEGQVAFNAFGYTYKNVYMIDKGTDSAQDEKSFLLLLKNFNSGLTLIKATDSSFKTWASISLDSSGNVTIKKCN